LTPDWTWPKCVAGGRHEFAGFGEAYRRPPDDFAGRVMAGLPGMWTVKNATFAPLEKADRKHWRGGVSGEAGYLPRLSLHRDYGASRAPAVLEPESAMSSRPSKRLDRAWFGGYLFAHFGHFILESIARIVAAEVAASSDPVVFLPVNEKIKLSPKLSHILPRIGIAPERIVLADSELGVAELRGMDPAYELIGSVHPAAYRRIQTTGAKSAAGKILWLSRTRHTGRTGRRMAHGEDILEARLQREFGAEIVYPEELPFERQIEKFAQASVVIGCEGSAFYTAMFLGAAPHLIKLCGSYVPLDLVLADEVCDGSSTYIFANREPFSPSLDRAAPWHLDVDRTLDAIARTIGGIRRP